MSAETPHPLTDAHIDEFWPDMAIPEGRAEIRRQFDTLMEHLARSKPRPFPRHPELMASIVAEKSQLLPERVEALRHGLAGLPEHWEKYQWRADDRDLFGERYIRFYGDDGHGMGRQAILAVCSGFKAYFGALAHFIAAANPDTIRMLLAEREALQRERDEAVKALETARAATASDPAPATDDRGRLLEENKRLRDALVMISLTDWYTRRVRQHPDGGLRGMAGMLATRTLTGENPSYLSNEVIIERFGDPRACREAQPATDGGEA